MEEILERLNKIDNRLDKIELLIHILYEIPYEGDIKIETLPS
jgi:hypothetical protein